MVFIQFTKILRKAYVFNIYYLGAAIYFVRYWLNEQNIKFLIKSQITCSNNVKIVDLTGN